MLLEMMLSSGCVAEDRVKLSDIAEQFAEFILEKMAGKNREKQVKQEKEMAKPRRKKRWDDCVPHCTRNCRNVCTNDCWWSCDGGRCEFPYYPSDEEMWDICP